MRLAEHLGCLRVLTSVNTMWSPPKLQLKSFHLPAFFTAGRRLELTMVWCRQRHLELNSSLPVTVGNLMATRCHCF